MSEIVYFVQAEGGGPIKIGWSTEAGLAGRLTSLQCGSPEKLAVTGRLPGGRSREVTLHMRFAKHRLHGEWFEAVPELVRLAGAKRTLTDSPSDRALADRRAYRRGFRDGYQRGVDEVVDGLVDLRRAG